MALRSCVAPGSFVRRRAVGDGRLPSTGGSFFLPRREALERQVQLARGVMFVLASIQDTVRVPPGSFSKATEEVLRHEIDAKYAGRVVADVGLCICCRDVLDVGDGLASRPGWETFGGFQSVTF